ncbi:unnamed protein product, partial [Coccothraustes coccothraustes]
PLLKSRTCTSRRSQLHRRTDAHTAPTHAIYPPGPDQPANHNPRQRRPHQSQPAHSRRARLRDPPRSPQALHALPPLQGP